jgi:hypothetical protein
MTEGHLWVNYDYVINRDATKVPDFVICCGSAPAVHCTNYHNKSSDFHFLLFAYEPFIVVTLCL